MATTSRVTWNPMSDQDYGLIPGKDVYSRDDEKVGSIKEVWHPEADFPASRGQHYFLMDPGLLKDWFGGFDKLYLPESNIESVTADRVVLNMTKDEIKRADWAKAPAGWDAYSTY